MSKVVHLAFGMAETISKCAFAGVQIVRLQSLAQATTCVECSTDQGAERLRQQFQLDVIQPQGIIGGAACK